MYLGNHTGIIQLLTRCSNTLLFFNKKLAFSGLYPYKYAFYAKMQIYEPIIQLLFKVIAYKLLFLNALKHVDLIAFRMKESVYDC